MEVRITCINKDGGYHQNPHTAISHYGWLVENTGETRKMSRIQMVAWMEKGNHSYVIDRFGSKAYCYVRTNENGTSFLQTHSNNRDTDNLLELPECR